MEFNAKDMRDLSDKVRNNKDQFYMPFIQMIKERAEQGHYEAYIPIHSDIDVTDLSKYLMDKGFNLYKDSTLSTVYLVVNWQK